jgi:hypothetical protein
MNNKTIIATTLLLVSVFTIGAFTFYFVQTLDRAVLYKYIKENHMRKLKLTKSTYGNRFYCVYAIALMTGMRQSMQRIN